MAKDRDGGQTAGGGAASWPDLLWAALVIGSVLAVLLLGAVLRVASPAADDPLAPALAAAIPDGPEPPPAAARVPPHPAVQAADPLAVRLERDLDRVAEAPSSWTAQLALLCETQRVRSFLAAHDDAGDSLYLLPAFHDDRPCVLISWGLYPNPERARAATDLPRALRAVQARPFPKRVDEVLRGLR